jgi:membrane-associated phospholipid phosphatase
MLELFHWLLSIDQSLFFFINQTLANPATDIIMPFVTSDWNLRIFYVICLAVILWKGGRRLRFAVIFSLLAVAASDQLVSAVLKPLLARPRPCHELAVHLLVNCGRGFSLPSSHAANLFAQAFLFKAIAPSSAKYLIPLAIIVALSRVFVGVHYPFDIVAGAAVGSLIGFSFAAVFVRIFPVDKIKSPEK